MILKCCVVLLFLAVVHQGYVGISMENDGLIYASIAKHLAEGQGSFWFPYSPLGEPAFHHHPPLGFWLQSRFFVLFGDYFWTENLYQFVLLMVLLAALHGSWRLSHQQARSSWRVWLMFLVAPIVAFVFTDNFLEVSLTALVSLAVLSQQLIFQDSARALFWLVCTAVLTLGAFLVKGPVGLFPLISLPLVGYLYQDRVSRVIGFAVGQASLFILLLALMMWDTDARVSLTRYIEFQWVGTAQGERPQIHGRGYQLIELGRNLLTMLLVFGLLAWKLKVRWRRETTVWLIVALLAVIPLLISPRQFKWYLAPSMPFFALAFASALGPVVELTRRQVQIASLLACVLGVSVMYLAITNFGKADNDFAAIHDVQKIKTLIPKGTTVGICDSSKAVDRYLLYLSRHHSVIAEPLSNQSYALCSEALEGYQALFSELDVLQLYTPQ